MMRWAVFMGLSFAIVFNKEDGEGDNARQWRWPSSLLFFFFKFPVTYILLHHYFSSLLA